MTNSLAAISLHDMQNIIAAKVCARRNGWPFDHHSQSADMADCMTRAVRVFFRVVRGARISKAMAAGF